MSWRAITEADVKTSGLTGPELTAARTTAVAAGVSDTLSDVMTRVSEEVVSYLPKTMARGAAGTIPSECLTAALARIVYELCIRLPRGVVLDEARTRNNDNAITYLTKVSRGDISIAPPETEGDEQPGGVGVQLVTSRKRLATRDTMAGL